ncbi:hypothetical protein HAX54_039405, partial [Datura stramonium]|nr:hypothetical protein [Datura stramonium]
MVNFRDYTSPSSKLKYLIIESTESSVQTKLLVHTPLTGWYAGPWPPLRNTLHVTNWTSECKPTTARSSQTWSLQVPHHRYTNIASPLPSLGRRIVRADIRWGKIVVFEGEYRHISRGSFYEEVIPKATKLTCVDAKDQRYIPRVCEYLFTAFHYLQESKTDSSRVSLRRWIGFWYKKSLRYEPTLPRREKKTARLKFTHNPTGAIPETSQWSRDEEGVFSKLGVNPVNKEVTYLVAFLSCWLCAFVLPSEEGDFIRPETFKKETMMATKRNISLAVPVLASIYSGLNKISQSSQLDIVRIRFPIHYVYGWLAHYFKTHYAFSNGPSNPLM